MLYQPEKLTECTSIKCSKCLFKDTMHCIPINAGLTPIKYKGKVD